MTTELVLAKQNMYVKDMLLPYWDYITNIGFPIGDKLCETDKSLLIKCPHCGDTQTIIFEDSLTVTVVKPEPHWNIRRRRLNTCYIDDHESNFIECCYSCYLDIYNSYEELWQDYYSSRL